MRLTPPPLMPPALQSGKFSGAGSEGPLEGLRSAQDEAEHENMKAVLRSGGGAGGEGGGSAVPGLRGRTRACSTRGQRPLDTTL